MIFRLFVVIFAIGYVNCDCSGAILSCIKGFQNQMLSGDNMCTALRTYIRCFFPACNMDITAEDTTYNNIVNSWSNYGIHCDSLWSDIEQSHQGESLLSGLNIVGMTTPGNSASSLKTLSSIFMFLLFLRALA